MASQRSSSRRWSFSHHLSRRSSFQHSKNRLIMARAGFTTIRRSMLSRISWRAALRIIQDETGADILRSSGSGSSFAPPLADPEVSSPGWTKWFIRRILLGLPIVGASSLVHLLLSAPVIGPVHWLARYRGNRRRENSRDMAALILVGLLSVGALRYACSRST